MTGIVSAQRGVEQAEADRVENLKKIADLNSRIAEDQKKIDSVENSKNPDKTRNLFFGGKEGRTPKQAMNDAKLRVQALNRQLDDANLLLDAQNVEYQNSRRLVTQQRRVHGRRSPSRAKDRVY